ncbi:MAG TPA: M48 family metalloprotease, partial [Thermohalobaculum sp.]|nr:M48 family metalloprotease [Thermohalobaculum sp.]
MLNPLKVLSVAAVLMASVAEAGAASLVRDAEIERTLDMEAAPILGAAGISPESTEIYIVNDDALNAFVAGGRNLFLNTGLLMELETAGELQGVIAHEVGHIAGGHLAVRGEALRNMRGPALVGALLAVAAGAAGGGGAAASAIISGSQTAVTRSLLSFSRGQEAAADQAALGYLEQAGIGPEGMLEVLEHFRGQEVFLSGNQDPYVLTHPLSSERMQLVERRAAELAGRFTPDPATAYWHGRMRAKLKGFLEDPQRVLDDLEGAPASEETLLAQAVALHRLARTGEALAAVDWLIATRPSDPYYVELKGQILFESGRPAEAAAAYRQALALAPDEPLIAAGLGRALLALNTPESDAEALRVLEQAQRADGTDPAGMRDLALAYGRAGDDGMATLATAERFALEGRLEDAQLHA